MLKHGETFLERVARIQRDHNVSEQEAVQIAKSEINAEETMRVQARKLNSPKFDHDLLYRQLGLTPEEANVVRRGSSIQAHYEGQLGTDC